MFQRFVPFAACALIATMPHAVQAFRSFSGLEVNPVNTAVFEVVGDPGTHGREYWCAAANYSVQELNAGWDAVIFIARKRGVSETTGRKSAVQFTLDADAAGITPAKPTISINWFRPGDHINIQQANSYCQDLREFN